MSEELQKRIIELEEAINYHIVRWEGVEGIDPSIQILKRILEGKHTDEELKW
jgi:hypothetical protein